MRCVLVCGFVVLALVIAGCVESKTDVDEVVAETEQEATTETEPGGAAEPEQKTVDNGNFTLTVDLTIYDKNDETDGTRSEEFQNPTPELIREKFNLLDWQNPLHISSLMLSRGVVNKPGYVYFVVGGTLRPKVPDDQVTALWGELPVGQAQTHVYFSPPITSKQQALELLLSFLAQDDRYRTLVKWEEQ